MIVYGDLYALFHRQSTCCTICVEDGTIAIELDGFRVLEIGFPILLSDEKTIPFAFKLIDLDL